MVLEILDKFPQQADDRAIPEDSFFEEKLKVKTIPIAF